MLSPSDQHLAKGTVTDCQLISWFLVVVCCRWSAPVNRTYTQLPDRASSARWRGWVTTLSDPFQTLSALPVSPYSRPVSPVPSTDALALITAAYSPIQSQTLRTGCFSQSAVSGGLGSARLAACWLPAPPPWPEERTPCPPEKGRTLIKKKKLAWGKRHLRAEGKPSRNTTPKTGTPGSKGDRGFQALTGPRSRSCYPRCLLVSSHSPGRCRVH